MYVPDNWKCTYLAAVWLNALFIPKALCLPRQPISSKVGADRNSEWKG